MFVHHRINAKEALKEGENDLVLTFWSGWNEAMKEQAANGGPVPVCESDSGWILAPSTFYMYSWLMRDCREW